MIGYIKGVYKSKIDNNIIVDCNGVGYKIDVGDIVPKSNIGDEIELHIFTYVRENELKLFGFFTQIDLEIFEMLISVNGVGPKVAINLVSQLGSNKIINSILKGNSDNLRVTGVGRKISEKIVIELKDKLVKKGYTPSGKSDENFSSKSLEEAKVALQSLGYDGKSIKSAISRATSRIDISNLTTQEILKILLSNIS